jgi:Spy/CpxP family protein refolding chaperone
MKTSKTTIGILAAVFTIGIATVAFAHGGYGGGYMMGPGYGGNMMGPGYGGGYMMGPGYGGGYMMGPGYGGHMMGYGPGYGAYRNGPGAWGNLSDKDAAALEKSREKFFDETQDLRNQIREKQIALDDAMDSANPDRSKVAELQKELSGLQAQFDQKAITHQLEVRKLLPQDVDQGAYGRGYGYGGYCWR